MIPKWRHPIQHSSPRTADSLHQEILNLMRLMLLIQVGIMLTVYTVQTVLKFVGREFLLHFLIRYACTVLTSLFFRKLNFYNFLEVVTM